MIFKQSQSTAEIAKKISICEYSIELLKRLKVENSLLYESNLKGVNNFFISVLMLF